MSEKSLISKFKLQVENVSNIQSFANKLVYMVFDRSVCPILQKIDMHARWTIVNV